MESPAFPTPPSPSLRGVEAVPEGAPRSGEAGAKRRGRARRLSHKPERSTAALKLASDIKTSFGVLYPSVFLGLLFNKF